MGQSSGLPPRELTSNIAQIGAGISFRNRAKSHYPVDETLGALVDVPPHPWIEISEEMQGSLGQEAKFDRAPRHSEN